MSVRILGIVEATKPIASPIANAYIDFSRMTLSLVAVLTDAVRDGRRVVGYGFNSNGRYGQGALLRERFIPRVLEAPPASLLDAAGDNLDPHKVWATMFRNEKPGGHGERSVAIGTIDMAVWARWRRSPGSRCSACWRRATAMARPTPACSSTRPAATTIPARTSHPWSTRCAATSTAATPW